MQNHFLTVFENHFQKSSFYNIANKGFEISLNFGIFAPKIKFWINNFWREISYIWINNFVHLKKNWNETFLTIFKHCAFRDFCKETLRFENPWGGIVAEEWSSTFMLIPSFFSTVSFVFLMSRFRWICDLLPAHWT